MTDAARAALETADWRRLTFELYEITRLADETDGLARAHEYWRLHRNDMLAKHAAPSNTLPVAVPVGERMP